MCPGASRWTKGDRSMTQGSVTAPAFSPPTLDPPSAPHEGGHPLVYSNRAQSFDSFRRDLPSLGMVNGYYDAKLELALDSGDDEVVRGVWRELAKSDRFFLLTRVLGREDANRQWLYEQCRVVESDSDEWLDLWAREHYKSTIITYAGIIQEILKNPEITIGIFSYSRPIAKSFLKQIMVELQDNEKLAWMFPDIFWDKPRTESPSWGLNDGITVKRQSNPNAATVEAWGLIDSQPTSKHFMLRVYNDCMTAQTTREGMLPKVIESWKASLNLGAQTVLEDGTSVDGRSWYEGTLWHWEELYTLMARQGTCKVRLFPATDTGKLEGTPVLWDRQQLMKRFRDSGPFMFACNQLLDPTQLQSKALNPDWIQYYSNRVKWREMTRYLMCDPSKGRTKKSDYTAMVVVGLDHEKNFWILDAVYDRLSLVDRARLYMDLHREWEPTQSGYEQYALMSDIEYIYEVQKKENYRFHIEELKGNLDKESRIDRLIPKLSTMQVFWPASLMKVNADGVNENIIGKIIEEEYKRYPNAPHDDFLDVFSRVFDMRMRYPNKGSSVDRFTKVVAKDENDWHPFDRDSWG
jgi:phage terminase large subunit-like protein